MKLAKALKQKNRPAGEVARFKELRTQLSSRSAKKKLRAW
jgi:hypothetical protein